ncbi:MULTISPECIES: adenylate/guanylate cyclase domain-containing protein [unclassified Coleofasciculus]|uniref:adenylate/guanylate cyclase domain-containing protein n=1 Tax=unclassified Coleofasciculus TaxID=2692782 RepID=UPI00187DEFB4|nr:MULTISPECIES: adenylate/guanylate cyclase domain-containing protein [unclassified Coleofasciculus]MBE9130048.1 FHA domain-containing protein [Coleofasciculus sp. LEGE 07081]MBE9152400.1 FHA domain-containing protein [Coleofasciculus sp. LEGE 07092]
MPYLIFDTDTPNQQTYQLRLGVNTIGREQDNSIVVNHGFLSRRHAEIAMGIDGVTITDLNSLNGTFVNECKITQCTLKDGDLIRFGNVFFNFVEKIPQVEQKSPDTENTKISIVKQVSPDKTRVTMRDLLDQEQADNSLLRIRQKDAHQRAVDKLQILLEVSKQLSLPEEPDQLLQKILNLLLDIVHVDRAAILMVEETTGELDQKAVKWRSGIQTEDCFYSKRITDFVRHHGDAILTDDACLDELFEDSVSILKQGIHAAMCVPLKPRDEVIGVLYVDNLSMTDVYSDEDLEFLTCLANQAAIAIENSRLYKQMQAEAVMRNKLERFFPQTVSRKFREEGNLEIVDTEVTALFADISNFTRMSSAMEPRQIIEMLNEYFQVMVEEIVFPYEGTLEKYIGDALLAVWGAPYQKPNDVDLAVWAAIEMQWAVRRLNQEWIEHKRRPIQIHIGLNTGRVAAGNIGSKRLIQYATIGDTTNTTSRICNVAKANEILISETTFKKLNSQTLSLEKLPPIRVKGKAKPLQLYRVIWEKVQSLSLSPTRTL